MATAASRARVSAAGARVAALAALAVVGVAVAGAGCGGSTASRSQHPAPRASLPAGWRTVSTPSGDSTLAYPPDWAPGPSDSGSVSVYLGLSRASDIPRGYLNVTPQQGGESLRNWTAFRVSHNREEGDRQLTTLSSVSGRRIGAATASCLDDVYRARVGTRAWHELACFVQGPRSGAVFVGAAQPRDWAAVGPVIRRSLAVLGER